MHSTTEEITSNVVKLPTRARKHAFVETRSAEAICSALAYAKANGDMVCIFGAPGVGKTESIAHFSSSYDHVWVATMTPAISTVVPALEEIAEACGLREPSGGARRIARAIRSKVAHLPGVLIIDEAQHLKTAALEEIRSLHDATGIGIALVGNEAVYSRITGGGRQSTFAQLFSRLGMRVPLGPPDARDVAAIAAQHGIKERSVLEVLESAGKQPGGLRIVRKIAASMVASKAKMTADAAHTACDLLGVEV